MYSHHECALPCVCAVGRIQDDDPVVCEGGERVPLRKVVSRTPPTVVVRKKAVKPAPRSGQAQPVPTPAPAPAAAQSQGHPVAPPLMPAPAELQLKPFLPPQSAPQPQAPAVEAPSTSPATARPAPANAGKNSRHVVSCWRSSASAGPRSFPKTCATSSRWPLASIAISSPLCPSSRCGTSVRSSACSNA
jgi:hypothetical protein